MIRGTDAPRLLARTAEIRAATDLPVDLEDAMFCSPLIQLSATRGLLAVPGIGRYLLDAEGVRVAAAPGSTDDDVHCLLAGTVRALDLLLHDVFCLRAAAVRVGDRAVLICGPSACGKSVLAAALAQRGHALLADQLAPVVPSGTGPVLWPIDNAVQLWPPAANRLRVSDQPTRIVRPALAKRSYHFGPPTTAEPVPVGLVVMLAIDPRVTAVTSTALAGGLGRVRALAMWQLHGPAAERRDPLGHLDWLATVGSGTPMIRLSRPREEWTARQLGGEIEAVMATS